MVVRGLILTVALAWPVGAAWAATAAVDTTEAWRPPATLDDLSDPQLEVSLWPPTLRAYGLVWVPKGTAGEARGLGLGADTVMPFRAQGGDSSRTSELAFGFLGTTKGQWQFHLGGDFHWNHNRNYVRTMLGFDDLARSFFGVGPAADTDDEEFYRPNELSFHAETTWRLGSTLGLGPRLEYDHQVNDHIEPGGLLASGGINGVAGGDLIGGGLTAIWDRRNTRYGPFSGWYVQSQFMSFANLGHGGRDFVLWHVDVRTYHALGARHVLAYQGVYHGVSGNVPFWRLASIGGRAHSRAYTLDRWLDEVLVATQAEWRWRTFDRFGLAVFGGAAVVDDSITMLQLRYLRPSIGFGLRYFAERGSEVVPIRLDLAVGYQSWRLSIGIDEAF